MNKHTLKAIGAVATGVVFIIVVTTLVDILLHAVGAFPPWNKPIDDAQALLASSYRLVIGIVGAYLTALLAPDRPLRHAIILGCVGVFLGLAGVVGTWNLGLGPRWYPISLAVLALPQCWAGGRLFELRTRVRDALNPAA